MPFASALGVSATLMPIANAIIMATRGIQAIPLRRIFITPASFSSIVCAFKVLISEYLNKNTASIEFWELIYLAYSFDMPNMVEKILVRLRSNHAHEKTGEDSPAYFTVNSQEVTDSGREVALWEG